MQNNRRRKLLRLWLVAALAFLLGTGLVLRPDRDAAQYMKHQHAAIDQSDLESRQLVTHIRLLSGRGLTQDQIEHALLSNGSLTAKVLSEMIELHAALSAKTHAEERLTLFAAVGLLPPLVILELAAALAWTRRSYSFCANLVWKNPLCGDRLSGYRA